MPEGKVWLEGGSGGGSGRGHYRLSFRSLKGTRKDTGRGEERRGERRTREENEKEGPSKGTGEAGGKVLRERKAGRTAAAQSRLRLAAQWESGKRAATRVETWTDRITGSVFIRERKYKRCGRKSIQIWYGYNNV